MDDGKRDRLREVIGPSYDANAAVIEKLELYVSLLGQWQRAKNLVSKSTLDDVWERHIIDSAQLLPYLPISEEDEKSFLDFGSGAGFPGLVIAIILSEANATPVHLVEANGKKCTFLKTVSRETGVRVFVHNKRLETLTLEDTGLAAAITARAFAPLDRMLTLSKPWLENGAKAVLLKGQTVEKEVADAARQHAFSYSISESKVSKDGTVLTLTMGESELSERHGTVINEGETNDEQEKT